MNNSSGGVFGRDSLDFDTDATPLSTPVSGAGDEQATAHAVSAHTAAIFFIAPSSQITHGINPYFFGRR